jgi:glutamyl-tRNA synthetase
MQRTVYQTLGDVNFREIPSGTVLQLERRGYYIVDIAWDPAHPDKPAVLLNIPDGRAKNM